MLSSINSIESFSTSDGPGIRTVIFLNKCLLRCKYCHNPETWNMQGMNYTTDELIAKIKRYKTYYRKNGGVTFSGGEPLLQSNFLLSIIKELKKEGIHIAIDTAGYSDQDYLEILENVDLIIYDIKDIDETRYRALTSGDIKKTWKFLEIAKNLNKKFWLRQVIVPDIHDNHDFIVKLYQYIKDHFNLNNIEKIEFIPYHKLGSEKYIQLGIKNVYQDKKEMDPKKCNELYQEFMSLYKKQ